MRDQISAAYNPRWYVVAVETRREIYAKDNIEALGLSVYLPMVTEIIRHARAQHEEKRPMFNGYLFVRFCEATDHYAKLYSTRGVVGIVQGAGCFGWVPDPLVSSMMALEAAAVPLRAALASGWCPTPGNSVRVCTGAWAGLVGRVVAVKGAERVRLLLGALNVVIGADQVAEV